MKTPRFTFILGILSVVVLLGSPLRLVAAQPEMNDAIEQLEKAKHSDHPIEHLEKAKWHLEEAARNKHGERLEAIHQVHEALEAARKGDRHRMEEHVERAIHEVREGKHEAWLGR